MRHYDRLSALDAAFLGIETPASHMHVGAVAVFGPGPLVRPDGGIDVDDLRDNVGVAIAGERRYRQRLARVRVAGHWAWVDDEQFNLHFHVRHTRLPSPGDDRQLKRLAGRIFSQRLDRDHPLWELWFVEGLAGGRFALIAKVHHCLIDGTGGARLLHALLGGPPPETATAASEPSPGAAGLALGEIAHRVRGLGRAARALGEAARSPLASLRAASDHARSMTSTLIQAARPASATAVNPPHIGPHRRFDWTEIPLDRVRPIRHQLGGTVNDAILATVAGGLRRFLARRGDRVDALDDVRALVPVNIRRTSRAVGNAISTMLAPLPVRIADPRERYRAVCETTRWLKTESRQVESAVMLEELADATSSGPLTASLRLAARLRAYNVVVTNVLGPPVPLALFGSRLEALYPMAPLFETQSVGVAAFSYAGTLFFGISGDWHRVPDLHDFVADLDASFDELEAAARAEAAVSAPPGPSSARVVPLPRPPSP
jgi:diacylglycerol O-acyltransferase